MENDIIILDDRHEYFNVYLSDCGKCKHYNRNYSCVAFPDGIPLDILSAKKTHRVVVANQTGTTIFTL